MPLVERAHHTSFPVQDLQRSCDFYEGVLGLERIERPELGVRGVWYGVDGFEVHLIETPAGVDVGPAPAAFTPLARHVAFAVRDYAATLAALRARQLPVLETSARQGQLWTRDPDGHVIELIVARK